jgi:hypothetical protein
MAKKHGFKVKGTSMHHKGKGKRGRKRGRKHGGKK